MNAPLTRRHPAVVRMEELKAEVEQLKATLEHHKNNAIGMMQVATENERLKTILAWEQKQHLGEKELVSEIERLRAENSQLKAAWFDVIEAGKKARAALEGKHEGDEEDAEARATARFLLRAITADD